MVKGQVSSKDNKAAQLHLRQQRLGQWSDLLHGFIGNRLAVVGAILMLIILILAILAPFVKPHDPLRQNLRNTLVPPAWYEGGSINYLLGTDHFGRDILSRLLYGARASLPASGLAAIFALILGTSVGLVAGYFGGALDTVLTGIVDVFLAFPLILMALALAAILGPSLRNLVIVMALTGWMSYARVIRSAVLSLKNTEFVTAATVIGARDLQNHLRHIFPNVIGQTLVLFAYGFSQFIILESALSFLGLGIPPPTPTWGRMLYEGRDYLTVAPWTITFPGIAIMLTVLSNNFIGDGLRDALDPSLRRSVQ